MISKQNWTESSKENHLILHRYKQTHAWLPTIWTSNTWACHPAQGLGTKLCKKCRYLASSGSLAGLAGQQVGQQFQEQRQNFISPAHAFAFTQTT